MELSRVEKFKICIGRAHRLIYNGEVAASSIVAVDAFVVRTSNSSPSLSLILAEA